MGPEGVVAYCTSCRCERLFVKNRIRHLLHFLATVFTGGLWIVPWLAICVEGAIRPWRCEACGWYKPEFRRSLRDTVNLGEAAMDGSRGRQSAKRKKWN